MSNPTRQSIINALIASVEIPSGAYEQAESRYNDLGEWFERPESRCSKFQPHIYSQGSFRLGTVVRPLNSHDEYDLDVGCRLREGFEKKDRTQSELKNLVGKDLEDYRVARGINDELEAHHRCWRLSYADKLKFHMDVVPSIPEEASRREVIKTAMLRAGTADFLARAVSESAGAITDDRLPNFDRISDDWKISNSEGYARWFESRMKQAEGLMQKRAAMAKAAKVDDLPAYRWKSPLQQCVQILKRHRDKMFDNDSDGKPISIIITTLAGAAYQGEVEIDEALNRILTDMGGLVRAESPRVPNPVNPVEDFADKWSDPKCEDLNLEENFWKWLKQAQSDFEVMTTTDDAEVFEKVSSARFGVNLTTRTEELRKRAVKKQDLLEKAAVIGAGAKTNTSGVIGSSGVSNRPHKFYGEEIYSEKEA